MLIAYTWAKILSLEGLELEWSFKLRTLLSCENTSKTTQDVPEIATKATSSDWLHHTLVPYSNDTVYHLIGSIQFWLTNFIRINPPRCLREEVWLFDATDVLSWIKIGQLLSLLFLKWFKIHLRLLWGQHQPERLHPTPLLPISNSNDAVCHFRILLCGANVTNNTSCC